jgi:hypothetical protein
MPLIDVDSFVAKETHLVERERYRLCVPFILEIHMLVIDGQLLGRYAFVRRLLPPSLTNTLSKHFLPGSLLQTLLVLAVSP